MTATTPVQGGRAGPPPPVAVPRTPFVALILLVVTVGVLGILLLNTRINENAFVLYELRQEQEALDARQQQLEQEIAQAGSTNELASAARQLGLVDLQDEVEHLRLGRVPGDGAPGGEPGEGGSDDSGTAEGGSAGGGSGGGQAGVRP